MASATSNLTIPELRQRIGQLENEKAEWLKVEVYLIQLVDLYKVAPVSRHCDSCDAFRDASEKDAKDIHFWKRVAWVGWVGVFAVTLCWLCSRVGK